MTEEEKKKALDLARRMGLIVSFTNEQGVFYTTDGHERKRLKWEEIFPKFEEHLVCHNSNSKCEGVKLWTD